MITDCRPDEKRLALFHGAMDTFGVEAEPTKNDPRGEWTNNVLTQRTRVYSCGRICRLADSDNGGQKEDDNGCEGRGAIKHRHDKVEFALCQRLAAAAAKQVRGFDLAMDSESDASGSPFFIVANTAVKAGKVTRRGVFTKITPESVRRAFGGTLYPGCRVSVVPMTRGGKWERRLREHFREEEREKPPSPADIDFAKGMAESESEEVARAYLKEWNKKWRATCERRLKHWLELCGWFAAQPELRDASFVSVLPSKNAYDSGPVYPRLIVALTDAGSLVGLYYEVVQT